MIKVTILMPVYNDSLYLQRSIEQCPSHTVVHLCL